MKQLPGELLKSLSGLEGFDEKAFIEAHLSENRITSIRLNPFKPVALDFELGEAVSWCSSGYYLKERPSFTHDPLFHAGCYYVQEAGSMFIEHALKSVLDFSQALTVLDLCGAPGGKSTLINSLINEESLLIANEIIKPRAGILATNLDKWGTKNTVVANNDPQKFSQLESFFDAMVVDAPCSGSGLFRKQPEAIDEWSVDSVNLCSARQKRILADALPALKPGGYLVYSTCSYSVDENENIVDWLMNELGFEYVPLSVNENTGIVDTGKGYRFYPHRVKSEGFFCAVLRKTDGRLAKKNSKNRPGNPTKAEMDAFSGFFDVKNGFFVKNGPVFHFSNAAVAEFVNHSGKGFYLKKAGITVGEIKGGKLVPDHSLALSLSVNTGLSAELSLEQSLKYLKKEAFTVPETGGGFRRMIYKNQGLGWAKLLPNRINNYLPNELRILNR